MEKVGDRPIVVVTSVAREEGDSVAATQVSFETETFCLELFYSM